MHLDIDTLNFAWGMVTLSIALLSILIWSTGRMYAGFGRWTVARAIAGAAIIAANFHWWRAEQSKFLALSAIGIISILLSYEAIREFLRRRPESWAIRAIAGLGIVLAGALSIGGFQPASETAVYWTLSALGFSTTTLLLR